MTNISYLCNLDARSSPVAPQIIAARMVARAGATKEEMQHTVDVFRAVVGMLLFGGSNNIQTVPPQKDEPSVVLFGDIVTPTGQSVGITVNSNTSPEDVDFIVRNAFVLPTLFSANIPHNMGNPKFRYTRATGKGVVSADENPNDWLRVHTAKEGEKVLVVPQLVEQHGGNAVLWLDNSNSAVPAVFVYGAGEAKAGEALGIIKNGDAFYLAEE